MYRSGPTNLLYLVLSFLTTVTFKTKVYNKMCTAQFLSHHFYGCGRHVAVFDFLLKDNNVGAPNVEAALSMDASQPQPERKSTIGQRKIGAKKPGGVSCVLCFCIAN